MVGAQGLAVLILTSHQKRSDEPFSEYRPGLDHVSLAVLDVRSLAAWQEGLSGYGVHSDLRRSEWGHHSQARLNTPIMGASTSDARL